MQFITPSAVQTGLPPRLISLKFNCVRMSSFMSENVMAKPTECILCIFEHLTLYLVHQRPNIILYVHPNTIHLTNFMY